MDDETDGPDEVADEPDRLDEAAERAFLAAERGDFAEARAVALDLTRTGGDDGDTHYTLARIYEALEDEPLRVRHDLEALRLDRRLDHRLGLVRPELIALIEAEASTTLASLPEALRDRLANVPVLLEPRPSRHLVREGLDPRTLGLFEGLEHGHAEHLGDLRPTRIVLFHANLAALTEDPVELREQVRITVLHELGHFFGLDEDDVERLGLG